jgi:hypothetical protein
VDVTGINQFVNLTSIDVGETYIRKIDVSGLENLIVLTCNKCPLLSEINVDGCKSLEELNCILTRVSVLDLSDCVSLKTLGVHQTGLKYLNMTNTSPTQFLYKSGIGLGSSGSQTYLMLSSGLSSEEFVLVGYQGKSISLTKNESLKSIDLSKCSNLEDISVYSCSLDNLILPSNNKLKTLSCYENNLTELNLSGKTKLVTCYCDNNKLSTLNVNSCTALKTLRCHTNNLETLDLSTSGLGIVSSSSLDCSPMNTNLSTLYLKAGANISGITSSRSTSYIPSETEIVFVD